MDGETYGCVKSFCYLGDTLHGNGDPDVFFSVESITYQDDELLLTEIIITESIIIDSIRELTSNSAAGLDGIPSFLLLNCAHALLPSRLVQFK